MSYQSVLGFAHIVLWAGAIVRVPKRGTARGGDGLVQPLPSEQVSLASRHPGGPTASGSCNVEASVSVHEQTPAIALSQPRIAGFPFGHVPCDRWPYVVGRLIGRLRPKLAWATSMFQTSGRFIRQTMAMSTFATTSRQLRASEQLAHPASLAAHLWALSFESPSSSRMRSPHRACL